ncbi:hypothetical protein [Rhodococcus sp. 06-1460-1B]|uniref:hypothetical protein n=1 Tax=Rhodococcus sp. 06-1460-1B TaxID=2022501 RepID=UPI000B9C6458|nr:hypothetical protein [Rhodococcus sp. 06-1460-1B]OZD65580.1 hypothetical protein CH268_04175 [Rhodococcus sp. 06-1460-1B]
MTDADTRQRVDNQELGGALLKLNAKDESAALLLTKLFKVVADEATRTPRFAKALVDVVGAVPVVGDDGVTADPVHRPAPRKRSAAPRKAVRAAGEFDPFEVFASLGVDGLRSKLSALSLEQLKDIIAEQEIDPHREGARKRKAEVLVEWTIEAVKASSSKGSVFR